MGAGQSRDLQNNQESLSNDGTKDAKTSSAESKNNKKFDRDEILGPKPDDLTEEEKAMIRETWQDVESSVAKVGVVMFIK